MQITCEKLKRRVSHEQAQKLLSYAFELRVSSNQSPIKLIDNYFIK